MRKQLDFFNAEMVVFPLDRRWREVQQAARFLHLVHGEYAEKGWKRICRDLASELKNAGMAQDEVREQVAAFQDAVQIALQDLAQKEMRA